MAKISDEVKKIIGEVHPSIVATIDNNGRPNASLRGSFRVLDDGYVIFTSDSGKYTLMNIRG